MANLDGLGQAGPLGVILAGGRGSRMAGADKALLRLGGVTLLDHVVARLGPQVAGLAVSANGDPSRFAGLGLPVLPDVDEAWAGPLAGVLAGLDWAAGQGAGTIVTAAVDTPFLPPDLAARLAAAAGASGLALAATLEEGRILRHPTFGLWPVALREDLRGALASGVRKVVLWADRHECGTAVFPDPAAFFNVNTPEDLAVARERLADRP